MKILQMSFGGSILILMILGIRFIAKKKLPRKLFPILWSLVLLRLLLPVSIPITIPSTWNGYGIAAEFLLNGLAETTPPILQSKESVEQELQNLEAVEQTEANQKIANVIYALQREKWFLNRIWVAGFVLCVLFLSGAYRHWYFEVKSALPVTKPVVTQWLQENTAKKKDHISIKYSDKVKTPLTYGIFRPVILLPKQMDWEAKETLHFILLHEYHHICRKDNLLKLFLTAAVCVHWFNPIVWLMYVTANQDIELACDEGVVLSLGEGKKADYAHALIYMEEQKSALALFGSYFNHNISEERIRTIMKTKGISKLQIAAMGSVIIVVFAVLLFTGIVRAEKKQETDVAVKVTMEEENGVAESISGAKAVAESEDFSQYEELGISYDEKADCLYYDKKSIGYFKDELKKDTFRRFVDETGEIGIEIKRDKNDKITGIDVFPMVEVYLEEGLVIENAKAVDTEENYAEENHAEEVTVTVVAESIDESGIPDTEYIKAGVEWNNNEWRYENKTVAVLYDNGYIYTNDNGEVYLEIIRKAKGEIEEVRKITREQMLELMQ